MADLSPEEMAEWERALAAEPRSALREAELARGLATADARHAVYAARMGMPVAEWRMWVLEMENAQVAIANARREYYMAKDDYEKASARYKTTVDSLHAAEQRVSALVVKSARNAAKAASEI